MPLLSVSPESEISENSLAIQRLGVVDYLEALTTQREIHTKVADGESSNALLLLEHPSVYTAGKRTLEIELPTDGTQVIQVDRGGKITWHGPGQLIGYPIVKLAKPTELVGFVREIESGLIEVCRHFGLETQRVEGRSGVWVRDSHGDRKVAAIGIRVARGVSMHGFALNVNPDLAPFRQIIPCGIDDAAVTSLANELSKEVRIPEVLPVVEKFLTQSLMKVSA